MATVAVLVAGSACNLQRAPSTGDDEVKQGMQLFQERKFAEAAIHLETALNMPDTTVSQSMLLTVIGNCHNELKDYEKSLEYHDRAIAADPQNYKAYVNRGVVYRLTGQAEKAADSYTQALAIEPNYPELHASLGALAIHREQYIDGIKYLRRAIELQDELPVAHANLAVGYACVGRFDDAQRELDKATAQGYWNTELVQKRIDDLRKKEANP